ncbi:hypothetical protein LOK49_LG07G00493 [Camellia lanceoleosa]|uniref:Uncharacterized protein n=1 Tax=Camellia lanceoleosa TaxID=1840588 RepID=A0ACC0H4Z7_9ERIC|nr:hypothetical protein LOK49_LG07G00493 [Camellia lanceoleosa]
MEEPSEHVLVSQGLSRIGSLSQVSGALGCQWGDEGKGKLVNILAKHFDIVARCQRSFYGRTIRTCAGSHLLHLHHRKDAVISVQSIASSSSSPSAVAWRKQRVEVESDRQVRSRACWVVSGVMKVKANSSLSWLSTSTLSLVVRSESALSKHLDCNPLSLNSLRLALPLLYWNPSAMIS